VKHLQKFIEERCEHTANQLTSLKDVRYLHSETRADRVLTLDSDWHVQTDTETKVRPTEAGHSRFRCHPGRRVGADLAGSYSEQGSTSCVKEVSQLHLYIQRFWWIKCRPDERQQPYIRQTIQLTGFNCEQVWGWYRYPAAPTSNSITSGTRGCHGTICIQPTWSFSNGGTGNPNISRHGRVTPTGVPLDFDRTIDRMASWPVW